MDSKAAAPHELPTDEEGCNRLIERLSEPSSLVLVPVIPPAPADAPEHVRRDWEREALKAYKGPGPLKTILWNYKNPVVWMNALLAVIIVAVVVSQWGRLSLALMAAGLLVLFVVDFKISMYVFWGFLFTLEVVSLTVSLDGSCANAH